MLRSFVLLLCFFISAINSEDATRLDQPAIEEIIGKVIPPLMRKDNIPGMAIAVAIDGKSYCFNYGVASRETGQPVTSDTLFEIGSISKTFTATLAAYAQVQGDISLPDAASKYLPALRGRSFDNITLLNLECAHNTIKTSS